MSVSEDQALIAYPFAGKSVVEPPEEFAELRSKCPFAGIQLPSGDEALLVTRYEDMKPLLADPRFTRPQPGEGGARLTKEDNIYSNSSTSKSQLEGEAHAYMRKGIVRWFTAKKLAELRPRVEEMAEQLVDEMVARGNRPADLKREFTFRLPVWVICETLGVPDERRDDFSRWSSTLLSTSVSAEEMTAAQHEFGAYVYGQIADRRADPGGTDMISSLVEHFAEAPQEYGMDDLVLIGAIMGILLAGHETTTNMIAKGMGILLADRSRWEAMVADPSTIRAVVEEVLRFDPNQSLGMIRFIREDLELPGGTIPAGTTVIAPIQSANHDPDAFERPEVFDPTRSPNAHIAFGAGQRACGGQALARLELNVAFEVLARRLPSIDLAVPYDELELLDGMVVQGLAKLPVTW